MAILHIGVRVAQGRGRRGVARVYDRISAVYDVIQGPMEWLGGQARRRRVVAGAKGRVLEVGVGTGANLEHYRPDVDLVGVDIASRMLARARARARRLTRSVTLHLADAEALPFESDSFDTVVATCVFCSVADPVKGLREVARVVRADGEIRLLEHVRPSNPVLGRLFDWLSPLTRRLMGPELNRPTERNVVEAGLRVTAVRRKGIWREIVARTSS